jgi:hypothetical protein
MAISNMSTFQPLETQCILLIRCESMIFMFLKEEVINCSIGNIGDARGTSLVKRVLAALSASKASLC